MTKEEKFYNALKDLFIGAKIEGEGGFVNLMKIKSKYYSKIKQLLEKDIEEKLQKYPHFREELFDKLYSFFHRYFTKSGSIYFNQTPYDYSIYERIYTNDKDVILFWKTRMLYYVKTDRIIKSLSIEVEERGKAYRFFFDASKLEYKKANEKKELIYSLKTVKNDETIVFNVEYSEKGRKTKVDEMIRELKKRNIKITESVLERAFSVFERQSEVDYFINKNARIFLKEQFKLWLYQYYYSQDKEWPKERIDQLQILKEIAYKIIDFIAQFEDELVKIWNKPKFVLNSNYVITLDRIAKQKGGFKVIEKLLKHPNLKEQIKEWINLKIVEKDFNPKEILLSQQTIDGNNLNPKYQFLPIDTKYFKDLEFEILQLFDNLDESLDGWLIKSENYQALNTILPKFKERVQTIYIDPPFNKEQDADYFYSVKYKDSTWITLLENRLRFARDLLNKKGSIFVRCDYNGNMYVRLLMNEIFGEENFRNEISVRRFKKNVMERDIKKLPEGLDTIYVYSKNFEYFSYLNPFKVKEKKREGFWRHMGDSSGQGGPKIFFGKELFPPAGKHWKYSQEKINQMIEEGKLILKCKNCGYIHDKSKGLWKGCPICGKDNPQPLYWVEEKDTEVLDSNWSDIYGYSTTWNFQTENSEILLKRVIESTSNEWDLILDFFLGSGTTTAVAHKLKRKWIGVELGDQFYTVVLPRMKKVLFYDPSQISKEKDVKEKYNKNKAGGFFKYFELEQYEDTLRKAKHEDSDLFEYSNNPYEQYIFLKDKKLLDALEVDYKNNKVKVNLSKIYPNIDIAETLSNLKGKWIKKIGKDFVEFEDGERVDIKNLDYKLIKPLIWW